VFRADNIEKAFRFLASGKHIGKVLIKIREHEDDIETIPIDVKHQVFFQEKQSCIIVGGLGGFGLELADWLVIRGCRNLVMSSSRGITNGYQAARIK
jgi:fatty acid synthase, animal type